MVEDCEIRGQVIWWFSVAWDLRLPHPKKSDVSRD